MGMKTKSSENLAKALTLLNQTARSAQLALQHQAQASDAADIGELFLEDLRTRRAQLRGWIELLSREIDGETALRTQQAVTWMAPRSCRRHTQSGPRTRV